MTGDITIALERAIRLLAQRMAPSAELAASAAELLDAVRQLDEAAATASHRRASVLTIVTSNRVPRLDAFIASLEALNADSQSNVLHREIAVSLGAQLEARVKEAKKTESARDEARRPFAELTRRVQETAKKFATYPALAERAVQLLATDFWLAKRAGGAYRSIPLRPGTRALSVEHEDVGPIADEIRRSLVLPRIRGDNRIGNFWPGRGGDFSFIENVSWVDQVDADIIGEVNRLNGSGPSQQIVDAAVDKAQARLWAEFQKVFAAIAELKALDASLGNISERYPDGAPVWADELFPEWKLKVMSGHYGIVLPDLQGRHMAAE